MRLRKPCEHGTYDDHLYYDDQLEPVSCPGGEFLADDALVVWWCGIHGSGRLSKVAPERCEGADLIVLEGLWPARCVMVQAALTVREGAGLRDDL